jgi:dolichol-phosphate mannosyltransferase
MRILILIATYNERENIEPLLKEIFNISSNVHVLVIDDNSPDKTYELVENLSQSSYVGRLFLLKRPGKMGLGTAYVDGFKWAINNDYEIVMQMDADFSHHPKYIPSFLAALQENDMVLGSRYIKGGGVVNWGFFRRLISMGGSLYARLVLGLPFRDLTGGFKCFKIQVLKAIDIDNLKSNGYSFQIETTYKAFRQGFKIKEIPIIFEDRRVGHSKMSQEIFFEALIMVLKLRFCASKQK